MEKRNASQNTIKALLRNGNENSETQNPAEITKEIKKIEAGLYFLKIKEIEGVNKDKAFVLYKLNRIEDSIINFEKSLSKDFGSLNVGVIKNIEKLGINEDIINAYETSKTVLTGLGHKLIEVDFSELSSGICSYYVIAPAECSSNLSRFDGVKYGYRSDGDKDIVNLYMNTRSDGFGDEVKKRILIGTHVLSAGFYDAYYLQAQKVRRMIKVKFEDFFKDVDLIFMPTTLDQAFEKNRKSDDPNRMYKEDLLTIPANLAGLPAISFPNGFKNNLPIGGQLIGKYFGEDLLLNTTNKIQEVTDWHKMTP